MKTITDLLGIIKIRKFRKAFGVLKLTCILQTLFIGTVSANDYRPPIQQDPIQVSGTITDSEGVPLAGANVVEKGTTNGVTADFDGNFSINLADENATLSFSYIGYATKEVAVNGQSTINVSLEGSAQGLDEVVVVGYGSQQKSDITGSVASIPSDRLEQVPNANFAEALQGSVPGVSIVTNSASAEGGDVNITIRGRNSISADNGPLIVLDGVPYNGSISDIVPTDIKSIEVLKDASSAAIYGSRGANGVILITTNRGKRGQTTINYDGYTSIDEIASLPDLLTPAEFYAFKKIREPNSVTQSEEALFQSGGGTNWVEEALRSGFRQQHNLSVSGGSEATNFYVSGSFLEVEGLAINDSYERLSLRVNLQTKIKDWITLGTNTQLSYGDRSGLEANFGEAYFMNPLSSVRDEDGNLTIRPWPEETSNGNPLRNILADNLDETYKVFTNNFLQIDFPFIEGLSYKLNTGVEYESRNRATYLGRDTSTGLEAQGRADTQDNVEKNILLENIINFNKEFGKHKIFATALYSYQNDKIENSRLQSQGFPNDVLTWYQANVANLVNPSRDFAQRTLLSSMLRLNYGFEDRYNFTLTGRRDGYSGFGANTKWGNFYAAAFSWNVSNESFMEDSGVSTLKLRLSYGVNGNQAVDPYETLSRLTEQSYLNGSNTAPGYIPAVLGSPNLGWETTATYNLGVDYGFFNNRLRGSLDIYKAKTDDLLLERQISPVNGLTEITENIGATENFGVDFSVFANIINKRDFSWDVAANLSYVDNKIVELYGNGEDDVLNRWFIGEPIIVNYDYEFGGVWQIGDDLESSPIPGAQPGYAKLVDQDMDGDVDADDLIIIGQRDPKYFAGVNLTFSYKNLSLNVVSQGAFGSTKENTLKVDNVFGFVRRNTIKKNWWTPDNPTNEFYANHIDANVRNDVAFYESADYWRVRDITLSYNMPKSVTDAIGLNNLRVYFSGRNLFTITKFGGLDPEFTNMRGAFGNDREIPLQQTYTVGLNLSL